MTCAPSEDSDQPGYPPSLICRRCPHEETLDPWLLIELTTKTLISLGGFQADLRLRRAHESFCLLCHTPAQLLCSPVAQNQNRHFLFSLCSKFSL